MERDESAATGLNPATLGEAPLDDAFKGKLPMHGRIAARAVNVKGGLMNQRALEQAFGEKAELQFALSHKMSSKDGGGPDNDTGKCAPTSLEPTPEDSALTPQWRLPEAGGHRTRPLCCRVLPRSDETVRVDSRGGVVR